VTLEAVYPRLGVVLDAVEHQFEVLPDLNSKYLATTAWLYTTPEGVGAPAVHIYYDIDAPTQTVTLMAVHLAGIH
jgi:hypothetical protein